MTAPFRDRIHLNSPVKRIVRQTPGVDLYIGDTNDPARFDAVVLACHSDQALGLLSDASTQERDVLGAIPYQRNETVLHTDERLMPRRRRAWAAWNYHIPRHVQDCVAVTYNMNILQSLDSRTPFMVTLNRAEAIDPAKVLRRITYHHPVYTPAGVAAQRRHAEISGQRDTYFCGAYWGYGFHEDGVNSALAVCRQFGVEF